jgi:hypothetical protein
VKRLLAILLCSCALGMSPWRAQDHTYSGIVSLGFEMSAFSSDDGRGPYWFAVGDDGEVWRQVSAPLQERCGIDWGRVHLIAEGELSAPGEYGHLGAYERELRVFRVREVRFLACNA